MKKRDCYSREEEDKKHGDCDKRIEYTRYKEIADQLSRLDMKHRDILSTGKGRKYANVHIAYLQYTADTKKRDYWCTDLKGIRVITYGTGHKFSTCTSYNVHTDQTSDIKIVDK
jgi:hypothetical protein